MNDRTKSLIGLGSMLFVRLSVDWQGLCKYRNAFQLPWPAWGIAGTVRGVCLTICSHHYISPSTAPSIRFFSISMSLNWHYQFHYSLVPGWLRGISGAVGLFLIAAAWNWTWGRCSLLSQGEGCPVPSSPRGRNVPPLLSRSSAPEKQLCLLFYKFQIALEFKTCSPVFRVDGPVILLLNQYCFWS